MWSNHKVQQYHTGARMSVLETIVQSAALYSTALICLLATYVSASNGQYVCLDTLQPIIVSSGFSCLCGRCVDPNFELRRASHSP